MVWKDVNEYRFHIFTHLYTVFYKAQSLFEITKQCFCTLGFLDHRYYWFNYEMGEAILRGSPLAVTDLLSSV